MRLKDGDVVLYEEVATIGENGLPHIIMNMKKVKKAIFGGVRFFDKDDIVNYNYRVRYIFRDGEKIENCCYDPIRIGEETGSLELEASSSEELSSDFPQGE